MSAIICTRDPDARTTPAGGNDVASTRSRRPRPKIPSDGDGIGTSHPTDLPTSSSEFKSGKQMNGTFQNHERDLWTSHRSDQPQGSSTTWNIVDDQTVETSRTLHAVRAMCDILRHTEPGIFDVDPHGTTRGHPACIAATRATRDEKQEKSNVANLLEAQWVRGKAFPRGNRRTPWKKAPNDCDHPPSAIQKGGNAAMYYERCEICGIRWQRIPLTMAARDSTGSQTNGHRVQVGLQPSCHEPCHPITCASAVRPVGN